VDTNDLTQILVVIVGTVGSIVVLLFLLAAIEPPTTRFRFHGGGQMTPADRSMPRLAPEVHADVAGEQ
jgi:hypothetical protein